MDNEFREYNPEHDIDIGKLAGVDVMMNLSLPPPHLHKNFTVLGLFAHYVAGFLIFSALYLLSYDVHWHWYKLERKRVNMFVYTLKCVRIVHAVLATLVAIPIMLYTTEFLTQRFLILDMFVAFSGGYLTFDIFGKYNEHLQVYEPPGKVISYTIVRRYVRKYWLLICHHLVLVCLVYPTVLFARNDEGDFLVACILFTELCVPFTEGQWIMECTLDPFNMRYVVVSAIAIATTFVSRILIIPFIYEALADHMNLGIIDFILTIGPWWHVAAVAYYIPNVIWLLQNMYKTFMYLKTAQRDAILREKQIAAKKETGETEERNSKKGQ